MVGTCFENRETLVLQGSAHLLPVNLFIVNQEY